MKAEGESRGILFPDFNESFWLETSNTVRLSSLSIMGTDGQHYCFYLLSYVAEVYKVTWKTVLEIIYHLEGLQPCFCSAVPKEGKEAAKFIPV